MTILLHIVRVSSPELQPMAVHWLRKFRLYHVTTRFNRFQIGCVFAEYDQFYRKFYIHEFSYNFDTVLYQFLEIGTSDVLYVSFNT